jgi:DNA-directed RNA polymerase subunit M/transcription elongation factor TFIIS
MRFCPNCDNILIPKNKKLYCKACDIEFELDKGENYKLVKTIKHDEKEAAPIIVKEGLKSERISDQDRKAFEEFFDLSEADSY